MTPLDALIELLARVAAERSKIVLISDTELNDWPIAGVTAMKSQKLITKAPPATSVVCPGCEQACSRLVYTLPDPKKPISFVLCHKRSDTNRVEIAPECLSQWQCSGDGIAGFIADNLSLRLSSNRLCEQGILEIGLFTGDKRSQMLCLGLNDRLTLVAGSGSIALYEIVRFDNGQFYIVESKIKSLLDSSALPIQKPASNPLHKQKQSKNKDQETELEIGSTEWRKQTARKAANAKHGKPGGSWDKQRKIREIWATGKYSSRDLCAEQECAALDMAFSTARRALINTPDPA
ncbi:MAG: hypothetical protein KDK04_31595 [Candidatus Competibacteraceae bacterium]|nr:hypothetical protein [Candidatus Competibacteraceae bacterium]